MDIVDLLSALFLLAIVLTAFLVGRQSNNLARMELTAAVSVAKQDVGWTYERYRLEAMRMEWLSLPVEARREYLRTWGRPTWAKASRTEEDP